jgi:SAM-dependent methyltransferase
MNRFLMNLWYRFGTPPWVLGPRAELVALVESGRLRPGRALDLGCGEGDNAIFLAQHGFDVTGVDYAPAAIAKARRKAEDAGARVRFLVGDLTELRGIEGPFDVLVDWGTFDDLSADNRERYLANVIPHARTGTQFFMFCFEWRARWWERVFGAVVGASGMVRPGEVAEHFAGRFAIEPVARGGSGRGLIPATAAYLMTALEPAS